MLTQHSLSFLVNFGGIIDLQFCNYCHLQFDFSSQFQSSMTIFHHKILTKEGRANGRTHPSSMTIFSSLTHKKCHPKLTNMTLNTIFSVASQPKCYCITNDPTLVDYSI